MSCNKSLSHVFQAFTGFVQFLYQIWRVWTFYHVYITQNVRFLEIRNAENFVRFPKGKLPLIVRWWILCTISNLFCVWLRFFNMAGYENWQWKLILSPLGGLPWSKAMQPNKNICFDPSKIVCHCSLILTYKCLQQQLLFYCVLLWLVLVWKCSWWILCDFSARSRWNTASPSPSSASKTAETLVLQTERLSALKHCIVSKKTRYKALHEEVSFGIALQFSCKKLHFGELDLKLSNWTKNWSQRLTVLSAFEPPWSRWSIRWRQMMSGSWQWLIIWTMSTIQWRWTSGHNAGQNWTFIRHRFGAPVPVSCPNESHPWFVLRW